MHGPLAWQIHTRQVGDRHAARDGDDTSGIELVAPKTWRYLAGHAGRFEARKSSIYRGKSPFSIFGIGEYAFAPWKVAVSGLHRGAKFLVVPPHDGKPVMLDDTCYFLSFAHEAEARTVAAVLNSAPCQSLLASLVFPDAKRTLTVDLLQRLNLAAIARAAGLDAEWKRMAHVRYGSLGTLSQMELVMETAASVADH